MSYYNKQINEIFTLLSTSEKGLSHKEAQFRLKTNGPNEIVQKNRFNWLKILFLQFADILIIILLIAAIISLLLGERSDAIVIISIVALNSSIGFLQEFKASKAIDALKKMITPTAEIIRDGKVSEISAKELVVGDIIMLNEGDRIPADARILDENELRIDESVLTGESIPVKKTAQIIQKMDIIPSDQKNMVFMGTSITHGNGMAVVVATGQKSEFGKVAEMTQNIKEELSPLQKEIMEIGKFTAKATVVIGVLVMILGLIRGEGFFHMFFFAVSLAVAVVPEGLPTTLTIALTMGVQKMAKQKAIIRKLTAVETLGSATVICSDKTGTLTKNQMTVKRAWVNKKIFEVTGTGYDPKGHLLEKGKKINGILSMDKLFLSATLCNNAQLLSPTPKRDGYDIIGDPTEGALVVFAKKIGLERQELEKEFVKIHEIPFDSEKKRMITIHRKERENFAFMKGAPDEVLKICNKIIIHNKELNLTKKLREEIINNSKSMAGDSLRVLGFAFKKIHSHDSYKNIEHEFVFIGLLGMADPPRPEVKEAVRLCHEAGIKINIITGDFGETAKAIAEEVGIGDENITIVTGEELDKIDDTSLEDILKTETIFARVAPHHKLRIVSILQEMGEVVGVTGDGVNDAPALKKASIGISMGLTGTDVATESSDMVLADDSFATIAHAIRQGRRTYDNLKKLIIYTFTGIASELFTIFLAIFMGFPLPLLAIQILLIDLGAEVLPSLALSTEQEEQGIMKRTPRRKGYHIINKYNVARLGIVGILIAAGTLFLFYKSLLEGGWIFGTPIDTHSSAYFKATTVAFVTLIMFQMFNAMNSKTQDSSLFATNVFNNKFLVLAVVISVEMVIIITELPFFNNVLHTRHLKIIEWIWVICISSSIVLVEEVRKWLGRKAVIKQAVYKEKQVSPAHAGQ